MIAFVDAESSGLKEREGHLLEVAVAVTDDNLNEVSACSVVVKPVGVEIDQVSMDDVVRKMHTDNGLLAELRAGGGMRRHEAEELLIDVLTNPVSGKLAGEVELDVCINCKKSLREEYEGGIAHSVEHSVCLSRTKDGKYDAVFSPKAVSLISQTPLAGSTVGFDRRWLQEHMPKLEALFSYRSIDVSSLTELARRWAPKVYESRPKAGKAHRALADVRESIAYLRYYRDAGFVGGGNWA